MTAVAISPTEFQKAPTIRGIHFETPLLCDGEFLRVRIDFESIQLAFVFKFSVLCSSLFPNLLLFSESQHPEIKVSLALVLLLSSAIGPDTKPLT